MSDRSIRLARPGGASAAYRVRALGTPEGPPLLLIHGLASVGHSLGAQVTLHFAQRHRLQGSIALTVLGR